VVNTLSQSLCDPFQIDS